MSRVRTTLAWLLPACAIVASCGWLGLIEPTEARYAEIAREMLASGDWLVPRLNGLTHFDKPPLAYWSAASGMALFGVNEWGARLGAALAAAFILWCTARIARHAAGHDPLAPPARNTLARPSEVALAPLLLASTLLFFALSHQLASDIFLAAAVAGFYAAIFDPRARSTVWPFVALGVGFMAKGPVVLVTTVAPVLLAALLARDRSAARWLASWRGWLVFALIALPWYLAVVIRTRGLLTYFLHHQLWERYATTIHQRGGPFYYFLIVILAGALPWTWAALREWARSIRAGVQERLEDALLASWVVLPLVFFSFSGSKLPAYVLPLFPALAVLASRWPSEARRRFWSWAAVVTFAVLVALLAALTPFDSMYGSPRSLARKLREARQPGDFVVEYAKFNAGVPFYLGETVPMLEVSRDAGLEDPATRARALLTRHDFARKVRTTGRAWVVGNQAAVEAMAIPLGFKATRVAGSGDQTLVLVEWLR